MPHRYRSAVHEAIHEMAEGLQRIGAISGARLREYNATCLAPPAAMPPERIRALREREGATQEVFAHALGVTKNLVSDWERGVKRPGGPARRLLQLVEAHGLSLLDPPIDPPAAAPLPDAAA